MYFSGYYPAGANILYFWHRDTSPGKWGVRFVEWGAGLGWSSLLLLKSKNLCPWFQETEIFYIRMLFHYLVVGTRALPAAPSGRKVAASSSTTLPVILITF